MGCRDCALVETVDGEALPGFAAPSRSDPTRADRRSDGAKDLAEIARRPATNATRRRDLTAVSAVLRACVAWGWIETNPAKTWDRSIIRERRDPIRPPTDADVKKLLDVSPPMVAALVRFLELTGMRQAEAVGLEWNQVDLRRSEATLYRTKTNRPRVVPLTPPTVKLLRGIERPPEGEAVFWHGAGQPYRGFAARFRVLTAKAGVAFRCHDLRHKFAIDWLRNGGDVYELSRVLGHSSVKTTEIYLAYWGTNGGTVPSRSPRKRHGRKPVTH